MASAVTAGSARSSGLPTYFKLFLAFAAGVVLLVLGAALVPERALPQAVVGHLDGRREVLFTTVAAVGLGVAVGVVVALAP